MPNHLAGETSPYLLQHRENPVDWYPWGEEALARAQEEDRPLFLSIGYSACHWCHVMERESFEDRETADLLNEHFISIKVDREERPDLDSIYMEAVQAMTGSGGWPMSVFLTPRGKPFFGGTYFPPEDRFGMPSFRKVLTRVAEAYRTRRAEIEAHAESLAARIGAGIPLEGEEKPALHLPETAVKRLAEQYDERYGGFGGAPKFPQPMVLDFLLRHAHRTGDEAALRMADQTMEAMARGGVYDLLGGGFHRYSTDPHWLVPHFEKMLYDNALLARLYVHGYGKTGNPLFRAIAEETLDYVLREMTSPEGGFFSTQDADSEGEEGKFFLWTSREIDRVLGDEKGRLFRLAYGATEEGNFEGRNILHRLGDWSEVVKGSERSPSDLEAVLAEGQRALFAEREKRTSPARDEKVLTAWNGLMIAAFADGARMLGKEELLGTAVKAARFIDRSLTERGRLLRSWKDGKAKRGGYLEDYAYLADGLLALYQATLEKEWFFRAVEVAEAMIAHYADSERGGFYDTADDHEELIARPKGVQDNATPSGNAAANRVLLLLAAWTGEARFAGPARAALSAMQGAMESHPAAFGHWLGNLEFALAGPKEVAIVGERGRREMEELVEAALRGYRPNQVVAAGSPEDGDPLPLLRNRPLVDGRPAAYICRNFTCQSPITDAAELSRTLDT